MINKRDYLRSSLETLLYTASCNTQCYRDYFDECPGHKEFEVMYYEARGRREALKEVLALFEQSDGE